MACQTPFDVLRAKTEDLGPTLYVRASWRDPWLGLIPRDSYPKGAGYVRSVFQVGRSEPSTEEESWAAIQQISDSNLSGACNVTYNQTYVGMHEDTYRPENFGLVGPLICQDDLTMYWESLEFWEKYFQALEKRNRKSIINRLGVYYMNFSTKHVANSSLTRVDGTTSWSATTTPFSGVDMTGLNGASIPTSILTQEMMDAVAVELMEEGADEPNTNGWITQGADGPQFPVLIGSWMSHQLLLNNSELRSDWNQSFQGWGEANPVIQRLGASRVIKNWRHMVTRFPARWTSGTMTNGRVNVGTASPSNPLLRVPTFLNQTATGDKGYVPVVNPDWRDPALANYEAAVGLNPWVMTEEVLQPVNSAPGMKWQPQNYFGEWDFVTGNDALLGFNSCTGTADPKKKLGRHFAEYRHAVKPIFPLFGRMFLFARCSNSYDTVTCS